VDFRYVKHSTYRALPRRSPALALCA